jgi:molecular chaperone Hsp33
MIPVQIEDAILAGHLASIPSDGVSIFTLGGSEGPNGGEVRGAILSATSLVASMRASHGLGILETLILGQAYMAALLMASMLKGEDRLALRVDCDGPARGLAVEGRASTGKDGRRRNEVRGCLFENPIPVSGELSSFDTAPSIGTGSLAVTRYLAGMPQPFTGSVRLKTGRLAEDLSAYYLESEQTKTAFDLSIGFDHAGRATGAGAIFLQVLPGARDEFVSRVEAALLGLPSVGAWFQAGKKRAELLAAGFSSLGLSILGEGNAAFSCDCSRESFASFIAASSDETLRDFSEHGPWPLVTTCHNCSSSYSFAKEELEAMAARRGLVPRGEL